MTKDTKKTSSEEYQFPEEEYVSAEQSASSHEEAFASQYEENDQMRRGGIFALLNTLPFLKNKRVLIVIGIAVLALILLKLFHGGEKTKIISKKQQAPAVQTVTQPDAQINGELSVLHESQAQNENNINQLNQQVQDLQNSISQASQGQDQIKQDMSALIKQVSTLTQEVKTLNAENKAKKQSGPQLVYHLKAILPGRAWIVDNKGHSETVAIGDQIKDYGRVESVDPVNGILTTSSGKHIVYGAYDS